MKRDGAGQIANPMAIQQIELKIKLLDLDNTSTAEIQ
jgi:hypothetical protein